MTKLDTAKQSAKSILIPVSAIQAARKLLTRLRFGHANLAILTHVLATVDAAGITLAVTDLNHWLETRIPATINPDAHARVLIPAATLVSDVRGDKERAERFDTPGTGIRLADRLYWLNTTRMNQSNSSFPRTT